MGLGQRRQQSHWRGDSGLGLGRRRRRRRRMLVVVGAGVAMAVLMMVGGRVGQTQTHYRGESACSAVGQRHGDVVRVVRVCG